MEPRRRAFTLPTVRRVPLYLVVLSIPSVIGVTWWRGTRDYDFLKPPSATEIETARTRATAELARPADLFGIEEDPTESNPGDLPKPEAPKAKPKPPSIDVSDPTTPPPIDAWTERTDLPAASFIELASRLESNGHLAWARVTWERVIDHADANPQDREVAVRAIARIRPSLPPPETTPKSAPEVRLVVTAPKDRVDLTRRAAGDAAEALALAADRSLRFTASVAGDSAADAGLRVSLRPPGIDDDKAPSASSEAPADPDQIRRTILDSCFKLVASALAARDALQPVSPPAEEEAPAASLSSRITRQAWAVYATEN